MKKSFLKRAMAAAVAVPVALTQTVLCASLAADETIDASTFMSVAADAPVVGELKTDATAREYVQASDWNVTTFAALTLMAGQTYDLDTAALADSIASTAWYSEILKSALKNGAAATATVNADNVVITVDVNYDYALDASATLSEKLGGMDVAIDADPMSGQVVMTITTADLYQSTTIPVAVEFVADANTELNTAEDVVAYIQTKLDILKAQAMESTGNAAEVEALFASYQEKLDNLKLKVDLLMNDGKTWNYAGANYDEVLAAVQADYPNRDIPDSVAAAMENDTVVGVLTEVVAQLNEMAPEGYAINLTAADLAAAAQGLFDVTVDASVGGGVASAVTEGYVVDTADFDAVKTYFEGIEAELGYEIVEGTFETVMVYDAAANGNATTFTGDLSLNVERLVSYEVKETEVEPPTPVVEEEVTAAAKTDNFYFSHDDTVLTADMLLDSAELTVTTDGVAADPVDVMANMSFGLTADAPQADLTPAAIYEATGAAYAAVPLYVFYTAEGAEPVLVDVTVDVYVGVKGDATLTGECDAVDASTVLVFATAIGAGEDAVLNTTDEQLDKFALFLADIDTENKTYDVTAINATDASAILVAAVEFGAAGDVEIDVAAVWDDIMTNMGV